MVQSSGLSHILPLKFSPAKEMITTSSKGEHNPLDGSIIHEFDAASWRSSDLRRLEELQILIYPSRNEPLKGTKLSEQATTALETTGKPVGRDARFLS